MSTGRRSGLALRACGSLITGSSVNFAGPVCFTRIRDGTPHIDGHLPRSRGAIGDGLASRFTIYGWLTLCWRI